MLAPAPSHPASSPTDLAVLSLQLRNATVSDPSMEASSSRKVGWEIDSEVGKRSPPMEDANPSVALHKFISSLLDPDLSDSNPNLLAVGYELEALLAIHGEESVRLCASSRPASWDESGGIPSVSAIMLEPGERIRYELSLPLFDQLDDGDVNVKIRILVSLPPTYPNSSPPQLQLLGRYVGQFPIDAGLFGTITRTYISSTGVPFTPGDVCVFEGLQHTLTVCREWYTARQAEGQEGEKARETERKRGRDGRAFEELQDDEEQGPAEGERPSRERATFSFSNQSTTAGEELSLPASVVIHSSEPIVERRSAFQGHAVQLDDPRHVPLVIHQLLSDRKIAKATHPAIFAYRISQDKAGKQVLISDNDDDGESAAGARLAHLLQILELDNVLVVVSRWYGGILLGPERFKHINQAARDALELAGLLGDKADARKPRR